MPQLTHRWDYDHELVGRVCILNSGGPLLTVTGVHLDVRGEEPVVCEYDVRWFNAELRVASTIVNVRWVELLEPDDELLATGSTA